MGMTIDVAKVNLQAIQVYYNDDMQDSYVGFDKEDNESIDFAIEIMKKYQKIEQIVDRPTGNNAEEKAYNYMMIVKDIKEVLEDGKID